MSGVFINILVCLKGSKEPMTRVELEKATGLNSATITRQLDKLCNYIKQVEVSRFRPKLGRKTKVPGYLPL